MNCYRSSIALNRTPVHPGAGRARRRAGALGMAAAMALSVMSAGALAAPKCTSEARDKWMSESAMKAKAVEQGYRIKRFLISGSCYEIYGADKDGRSVEIYFDPTNGSIIKQRVRG